MGTIEAAWQDFVKSESIAGLPDGTKAVLKGAFFSGAGSAFTAYNRIETEGGTTDAEKEEALMVLYAEIDQFLRDPKAKPQ